VCVHLWFLLAVVGSHLKTEREREREGCGSIAFENWCTHNCSLLLHTDTLDSICRSSRRTPKKRQTDRNGALRNTQRLTNVQIEKKKMKTVNTV
jgi:hypothetical protein